MHQQLDNTIDVICEKDSRYKRDAYEFVMEALSFTQKKFKRSTHVTGGELLEGIKEFLLEEFGPLTLSVLKYWGVKSTEDFGHIVFNLVEHKVLSKTEDDNIESFRNGYNFEEVFHNEYREKLAKKIRLMRS